jgi:hypothetical protein
MKAGVVFSLASTCRIVRSKLQTKKTFSGAVPIPFVYENQGFIDHYDYSRGISARRQRTQSCLRQAWNFDIRLQQYDRDAHQ